MAWITLAQGTSLKEFRQSKPPTREIPPGTPLRLEIVTPWYAPIAPLADLFGAEWVAKRFINKAKARIVDVEGKGAHKIIVHMKAIGTPSLALILVIVGIIAGAVAVAIASIKLNMKKVAKISRNVAVAILGILGIYALSKAKRSHYAQG